jgi:DNA-binding transcriptional regulator YdaS (Cro superfamily)
MSMMNSPEKDALRRAADILGGQAALASVLGYSDRRGVWPYFHTDRQFPAEHCPKVEQVTRERGQPVLCEELRPDVPWSVLREQSADWDGAERRAGLRAEPGCKQRLLGKLEA